MPEQEKKYGTRITTAGSTLITNCILAGTKLKITRAAAGDGGGSYYVPSTEQTELVRELWRGPIVSAEQNATVPNMMDVKIIIDDSVGNFIVREMGL
ncbi:MAG: phage tail protein, partial [Evtepia gabavorous]|uniref:phage tail-collar fiber domain-containing protein n=1 Tax=Evtepia gabavorous TaxID=2211183 RepID=UPI002E792CF8